MWRRPLARARAAAAGRVALRRCAAGGDGGAEVVASFYPLQYVAERIVGDHAEVANLTTPGRRAARPRALAAADRRARPTPTSSSTRRASSPPSTTPSSNDAPGARRRRRDVVDLRREADRGRRRRPALLARPDPAGRGRRRVRRRAWREADPDHAADYRRRQRRAPGRPRSARRATTSRAWRTADATRRGQPRRVRATSAPLRPRRAPDRRPLPRRRAVARGTSRELADLIRTDEITTVFSETPGQPQAGRHPGRATSASRTAVLDPIEGLTVDGRRRRLPHPDAREPRGPARRQAAAHDADRAASSTSTTAPASPSAAGRSCATSTSPCAAGEVVALLGANGSGKSTLVKAMVGLHPLSTGAVRAVRHAADRLPATGTGSATCRSARPIAPGRARRRCARWSPPAGCRAAGRSCPARRADRVAIARGARGRRPRRPGRATRSRRCPAASSSGC